MKSTAATLSLLCGAAVADVDTTLGTNTLPTSVGMDTGNQAYRCGGKQKGFALTPQSANVEVEVCEGMGWLSIQSKRYRKVRNVACCCWVCFGSASGTVV